MTVGDLIEELEKLPRDTIAMAIPVFLTEDGVWHEKISDVDDPHYGKVVVDVALADNGAYLGYAEDYAGYSAIDHPGGIIE